MPATRRTLLAGLAVPTLATGCHALPAALPKHVTAEPHPDADLLALGERWTLAYAEHDAACAHAAELEDVGRPELPAAVFVAEGDFLVGLSGYGHQRPDGSRWYPISSVDAPRNPLRRRWARWKRRAARPEDNLPAGGTHVEEREPWPEAQARADEIVAAWDEWRVALAAAQEASGYDAADAEVGRLGRALVDIEDAIKAASPRTLDGLAVQARELLVDYGQECQEGAVLMLRTFVAMAAGETA